MISFACPCGEPVQAEDASAGRTTRCPACGRDLDIPGAAAVQTADAARAPGPRPDEGVRRSRPDRLGAEEERPPPVKTSGMAIASIVFGVLALFPCSVIAGLPAVIFGILGLTAVGRGGGRVRGKGLAIGGLITGGLSFLCLPALLIGLLLPAVQKVREAAGRVSSGNNLKMINIGLRSYEDANGKMPAAAICDPAGKPLLSWRVAILPYIEQSNLYSQFKLDEPWDGPNNSRLIPMMPKIYAIPNDATAQPGHTFYRVFVGKGPEVGARPAFEPCRGVATTEIIDGPANTILVAESAAAVPWTKPDEMVYDPDGPPPPLGGHFGGGAQVVLVDGAVRMIPQGVGEQTLRAAITRNGNEPMGPDW